MESKTKYSGASHRCETESLEDGIMAKNLESSDLVSKNLEHGRIVVSTKNIEAGTKIIRESPLIVWQTDNWRDFFTNYNTLPQIDQTGILDMHYLPLDCQQLNHEKNNIFHFADIAGVERKLALKLASICMANSHEYYGIANDAYQEITMLFPEETAPRFSALFLYASKVSHSCHPNTTYTSKTEDGKMEYKAVREIKEGDIISFPYTENIWETPTHIRRKQLQETKSFFCKCKRCVRPDLLRLIKCENCEGAAMCTYDSAGKPFWSCDGCGVEASRSYCENAEEECDGVIHQTEMMMMMRGTHSVPLDQVKSDMLKIEQMLSPLHFLTLKATSLYVRLCASKAVDVEQNIDNVPPRARLHVLKQFGDPKKLRSEAAKAALNKVLKIECIANDCSEYKHPTDEIVHPAVYEAAIVIFHASHDLIQCPARLWPKNAKTMVRGYLPFMRLLFGETDQDVKNIERKILGISSMDISEAARSFQTLKVSEVAGTKTQSSTSKKKGKKKKGGSTKKKKNRGK